MPPIHRLYVDTNPVIYFVENHPIYYPLCLPYFAAIANGETMKEIPP